MNKGVIFILVLVVVFVLIFIISGKMEEEVVLPPSPTPTAMALPTDVPGQSGVLPETFIFITDSGFEPDEATIMAGEIVTFINNDARPRWPGSDIHPTHQLYPGSGLIKCGTAAAGSIFDACRGLNPGEFFSFTFNEKGAWFYHDHLQPTVSGKIIVK